MICKKYSDGKCELIFPEEFQKECVRLYPRHGDWPLIWQKDRLIDQEIADILLNGLEKRLLENSTFDRWTIVCMYRGNSTKKFKQWIEDLEDKEKLYRWFLELKEEQ